MFVVLLQCVSPRVPVASDAGAEVETIPFTLTSANNLSIRAKLDERHQVNLMFHTAVSGVSLTKTAVDELGVAMDQSATITSWGGQAASRYGTGHHLRIGDRSWDGIAITEDMHSGPGTHGKFGPDLFLPSVIEVDFDASVLRLHAALPELAPSFAPVAIDVVDGNVLVEAAVIIAGAKHTHRFLVHSGFGGTLLFDDAIVRRLALDRKLRVVGESQLRDSIGNVLTTKRVRVPGLELGQTTLRDVEAALFAGAIGQRQMSVLGASILSRFKIVLDLPGAQMFLQPRASV
ncbi:MAG: hypothetical protein AAF628_06175 [Planctomycetota bacterium]